MSHVIGTMSDKSVFGQCGPKNNWICYFLKRTICRKFIYSLVFSLLRKFAQLNWKNQGRAVIKTLTKRANILIIFRGKGMILNIWNIVNECNYINYFKVKFFVFLNNLQITNAWIKCLFKFKIINFLNLSMLVGISEAIRSLLIHLLQYTYTWIKDPWLSSFIHLIPSSTIGWRGKSNIFSTLIELGKISIISLFRDGKTMNKNNTYLINHVRYSSILGLIVPCHRRVGNTRYLHRDSLINTPELDSKTFSFITCDYFNEWLAGVIDGNGYFLLSKEGNAGLVINFQLADFRCLYIIFRAFGGSFRQRKDKNELQYRLYNEKKLFDLINRINGLIRTSARLVQLSRISNEYGINIYQASGLTYDNGWFSGIFDSDGHICLNLIGNELDIIIVQKEKYVLDSIASIYGGEVLETRRKDHFGWVVYKKNEVLNLLNYFNKYKLQSENALRIQLINKYYELDSLGAKKAPEDSELGKKWKEFINEWNAKEG